jgi:hypothetical protein
MAGPIAARDAAQKSAPVNTIFASFLKTFRPFAARATDSPKRSMPQLPGKCQPMDEIRARRPVISGFVAI